jgi:nucleoside-diphosphate-sugar epimerase
MIEPATIRPDPLAGLTIAVTGATGFIGRHLTTTLTSRGATVRSILRLDSPSQAPVGTTLVRANLETAALATAFADADAVVHLAGVVASASVKAYEAVNVTGTRAVAEAAREAGARLIHLSSLAAAGPAGASAPRSETDPSEPITPYGRSKFEGERTIEAIAGLDWTILRPGAVYGPGDRAMLPLFRLVRQWVVPVIGRQDAAFTFVHVSDLVAAITAAIEQHRPQETFFVGHPRPVVASDLVARVAAVLGRHPSYLPIPGALGWFAANACELVSQLVQRPLPFNRSRYAEMCTAGFVCRVDRLRDRLGVIPVVDLDEGLVQTADWYLREGWLKPH